MAKDERQKVKGEGSRLKVKGERTEAAKWGRCEVEMQSCRCISLLGSLG